MPTLIFGHPMLWWFQKCIGLLISKNFEQKYIVNLTTSSLSISWAAVEFVRTVNELFQTTKVPDVRQHDMFEDDRPSHRSQSFGSQKSAKLIITNLDYGVNDQDIQVWNNSFIIYIMLAVKYAEILTQKLFTVPKFLFVINFCSFRGNCGFGFGSENISVRTIYRWKRHFIGFLI